MSNETKRDVFLQLAKENRDLRMYDPETIEPKELIEQDYQDWIREYDAALPDNLPVIPKAVGDVIVKLKHKKFSLSGAMSYAAVVSLSPWMTFEHEDTFALAWVLGVWRVEETGEIVKLEAEK
ncbi:hypothetical protein HMPREF0539_0912 [Lacticaseibacillus rhamnosus LMS2-1]|uniref:DUF1642 domain-containing protein n=1 Tax=Lacticaseibacillus rhamnosus (strain LMS2-1) TaxID=525361 RepID=C2JVH8_LACRM|nr:hypothetical protein [Lacticaseibacillus rhamnosus]EEN80947.1 hypothetical protein HMPREF0539_0912 [Lacticaseibacillus rhamnosus LMS2-1]